MEKIFENEVDEGFAGKALTPRGEWDETLGRLNSTLRRPKKKNLRNRYNVAFSGHSIPDILLRSNIDSTQSDGVANLMALQYIKTNAVVLFVKGKRDNYHLSGSMTLSNLCMINCLDST